MLEGSVQFSKPGVNATYAMVEYFFSCDLCFLLFIKLIQYVTAKKMTAPNIVFFWGIKMLNHIILTI